MTTTAEPAAEPAAEPPAPASSAGRPRRRAALLNTSALLATTAVLVVTEPKLPPFRGD